MAAAAPDVHRNCGGAGVVAGVPFLGVRAAVSDAFYGEELREAWTRGKGWGFEVVILMIFSMSEKIDSAWLG